MTTGSLATFAKQHAGHLECLILEQPLLDAGWDSTMRQIGNITRGTLKFFKLRYPAAISHYGIVYMYEDGELAEASAAFSCPVKILGLV